jgi:hypothetical protein
MQYYLWSHIKDCNLPLGAPVDQGILKEALGRACTDADFAHMVDAGSIRSKPYPVPDGYPGSPRQYYLDSIEAVAGDSMDRMAAILELAEFEGNIDKKPRPAIVGMETPTGAVIEKPVGPPPDAQKVMVPSGS